MGPILAINFWARELLWRAIHLYPRRQSEAAAVRIRVCLRLARREIRKDNGLTRKRVWRGFR